MRYHVRLFKDGQLDATSEHKTRSRAIKQAHTMQRRAYDDGGWQSLHVDVVYGSEADGYLIVEEL